MNGAGDAGFRPHRLLRHAQLQSILATKGPRRKLWLKRGNRMEAAAERHVLECSDGVRLLGFHSRQPEGREPKALALLSEEQKRLNPTSHLDAGIIRNEQWYADNYDAALGTWLDAIAG